MENKGEWRKCINPKCGGRYHIDESKVVDIPCRCKKKSIEDMKAFAKTLRL